MIKEEEEDMDDNNHHNNHSNNPNHQNQKHQIPDVLKEADELETLGILEQDLPIELSFLIRQQAYCMARMNYLDRQIRELKETTKQQTSSINNINNSSSATCSRLATNHISNSSNQNLLYQQQQVQQQPFYHSHHYLNNRPNLYNNNNLALNQINSNTIATNNILSTNTTSHIINNTGATATTTTTKNGNFIPSDDSGGEYSRATISDDDELSSLLDQIAKSVKPAVDNRSNNNNLSMINQQIPQQIPIQLPQQPLQRSQYNVIHHNNLNQPYAILNPGQLHPHHPQAVPVFVMGSPITTTTTAHHPSSISSTILPGVHFQPEPRYNQYYEDFFIQHQQPPSTATIINSNNTMTNTMRHGNCSGIRSRQFDSSISAVEQLISQKEKRQIKSQLRSADNWLKMRSSGLCGNHNDLNNQTTSSSSVSMNGVPITNSTTTVVGQQLGTISNNGGNNNNNNEQVANNNGCGDVNIDRNYKTSTSAAFVGIQDNNNSVIDHQNLAGKSSKSR